MNSIIVEGHRGWRSDYPENSLVSFEAAMDLGVDAFEFDIRMSKDGVPVIMHDSDTWRVSGEHAVIEEMTLAEIKKLDIGSKIYGEKFAGTRVPTLKEVLTLVCSKNPHFKLGVEFKAYDEHCVDISVDMLKAFGLFENCWFYCFNARIIKYIKTKYNGRTMGYPDFKMKEFEADSYKYYDELGLSTAFLNSEILSVYLDKGLPIHFYCADDEETVRLAISKNASLITANNPVPLMKVLGRKINLK